jgi:zinc transport system substrate-binding protein
MRKTLVLLIGCICAGAAAVPAAAAVPEPEPVRIVASLFPLAEFARAVAGERGEVLTLIPPGAEVHSWRPRPSDILRAAKADLFIYIGADLEPWVQGILESYKNNRRILIEASRGMNLLRHEGRASASPHEHGTHEAGAADPHIWLDFEIDQALVDRIAAALIRCSPADEEFFLENAEAYRRELRELDRLYARGLERCASRSLILGGHAAFGYLARRYHLRQISLYGLSPDAEPTPRQMIHLVDIAREQGAHVIFFETQVSDRTARAIAREAGTETAVLNPGANLGRGQKAGDRTFLQIMRDNLKVIQDGLGCSGL